MRVERDQAGRITCLKLAGLTDAVIAEQIDYQPFGPRSRLTYGRGLNLDRQFDLAGRLTVQKAGAVQLLGYSFDIEGNFTDLPPLSALFADGGGEGGGPIRGTLFELLDCRLKCG